jgi:RNA polymerase sigma-70 factor (ECF subfamily)
MNAVTRKARFEKLVRQWSTDLYRFALWLCGHEALAHDLVQETFLRAWKALDSLQSDAAAKSWLITILRREHARTFERKQLQMANIEPLELPDETGLDPEQRAERALLRRGILQLPQRYREPLLLQVVMGLSCTEIAEQLGIGKGAVMTQLFRAREQLKDRLQGDGLTGNVHELF